MDSLEFIFFEHTGEMCIFVLREEKSDPITTTSPWTRMRAVRVSVKAITEKG
jgi:hypothetical protein